MDAWAAGVIAPLGIEIAFLIASLTAAVIAAIVAMEKQRNAFLWAVVSFLAVVVVAHAGHAVV